MVNFFIILLEVVIGMLSAYLIYYAQKKGRNQADKEDLKNITSIVEDVKRKNSEEIERLKADLTLLIDKEKQIFGEEKESIVIFFAQLNSWIWDSLNIYIQEYNHVNYQDIIQRLIIMRDAFNKSNVTYSKVKLIVEDEELVNAGNVAIMKTLELHQFKEGLLKELYTTLSWNRVFIDQIVNKQVDFRTMTTELRDFYQKQADENAKQRDQIIDNYFARNIDIFTLAIIEVNNFKDLAKKYLRK